MRFDNIFDKEKQNLETEPICSFPNLKKCLTNMGVLLGKAGTWHSVGTIEILPKDIGKRFFFEDSGIYYTDDFGIKHRGFMYKAQFFFEWRGRQNQPKFHVCKCTAIQQFGKEAYRFANAEPIKVYSRNAHKEVKVKGMELCGYCKRILMKKEAMYINDSTEFVDFLKETENIDEPKEFDVDIFGYVKNWEEISRAYRTKRNFTCERCGTHIEDGFDHCYMQTHHKNGVKTDNRESNLECLCIKCHSEVDDVHKKNYSSAAQKFMIEEYMRKYH